ncbi:uncharacterized protein cbx7b [Pseudoliparis swirei]|uniref:uncharacterized protein cbx7b n=1 Tax=Pseudoliparis swirei TaxID=2059687 RepID=UPI0024BDE0CB|nr:uncharacterized protein cbx7b [Pseudoliparis swirei]
MNRQEPAPQNPIPEGTVPIRHAPGSRKCSAISPDAPRDSHRRHFASFLTVCCFFREQRERTVGTRRRGPKAKGLVEQDIIHTMDLRSAHKTPEQPPPRLRLSLLPEDEDEEEDEDEDEEEDEDRDPQYRESEPRRSQHTCLDSNPPSPTQEDWEEEEEEEDNVESGEDGEEEEEEEKEETIEKSVSRSPGRIQSASRASLLISWSPGRGHRAVVTGPRSPGRGHRAAVTGHATETLKARHVLHPERIKELRSTRYRLSG